MSSIPELLRLAPNLQVARVSADNYAITARGFNGTTANKLLVLIDGRGVYTPRFVVSTNVRSHRCASSKRWF